MLKRLSIVRVLLLAVTAVLSVIAASGDAHAIIGRPLTPFSYAGVARRSVRRAAYAAPVMAAPYGAVPVLPTGCVAGVPCGGSVYDPYINGPGVVYMPR